jgi:integrin beta 3
LTAQARRIRLAALAAIAVLLLGALPGYFVIRDATRDPVFAGLDALDLPSWAAQQHEDHADGSRWCISTCRMRERTWRSAKAATETDQTYEAALTKAGWSRWQTAGCPKSTSGIYTCWTRDQYALDLWSRNAVCALNNVAPAPGASTAPSSAPTPTPTGSGPPATCAGALVTVTVADRADPAWHH